MFFIHSTDENIVFICNGVLFGHKEKQNHLFAENRTEDCHVKQNKPELEKKTSIACFLLYVESGEQEAMKVKGRL
jgi:hypothetical protein